jgi:hypothetical protein
MKKLLIILIAICSLINQDQGKEVLKPILNLRKSPLFWYDNEFRRFTKKSMLTKCVKKNWKSKSLREKRMVF